MCDTNDATLKAQILSLKASTKSEKFIMAVTSSKKSRQYREALDSEDAEESSKENDKDGSKLIYQNDEDDKVGGKARTCASTFKQVFGEIGYVMDVNNDPNVVNKMVDIMKNSTICK